MKEFIVYWMGIIAKFEVMLMSDREKIIRRRKSMIRRKDY